MERRQQRLIALTGVVLIGAIVTGLYAGRTRPTQINWQTDLKAAHRLSLRTDKPILLVFGAEWCFYCRKLERETLSDPSLARFINNRFVPVQLDMDKHKDIAKILEIEHLPASLILNSEADLLGTIVGYQRAPQYRATLQKALQLQQNLQQVSGFEE